MWFACKRVFAGIFVYTCRVLFCSVLSQEEDVRKALLVEMNSDLVSKACLVIRSAVANSMDWGDIELLVKDAQSRGDPVALAITSLKLGTNEITLLLWYVNNQ